MCRYKPRGIFEAYPCTIYCNQWLPQSSISVETKLVNCAEVPRVSVKSNPDRISMEIQTQGDCLVQCSMFPIPYSGRRFGGFWNQEEEQIGPVFTSPSKSSIRRFVITEKAPTNRAFSWLKETTTAFTFKTLLRHYAKRALTPRSLIVKLGLRRRVASVIMNLICKI